MTDWVKLEYQAASLRLKEYLAKSVSRVHFSFDIWTSPSCTAILGICSHSPSLHLRHALVGLKEIEGTHSGEAIAQIVSEVIEKLGVQHKLGVFVGDNASNIDSAAHALVRRFRPEESAQQFARRSRCLGHIVNLAAKAFLLGEDCDAFMEEVALVEEAVARDEHLLPREQAKWRSKGPIGKFHNIVAHIRRSPQRRQEFKVEVEGSINRARARGKYQPDVDVDCEPIRAPGFWS